ncbi:MAG: hypothetical protein LBN33_01760 [Desulfovibrio sp.]|nr:hypothetical protein [Desulfovibrio sp.]
MPSFPRISEDAFSTPCPCPVFFGGVTSLFAGRGKHTAAIGAFSALAASVAGLAAVLEYFFLPASPTYIVLGSLPIGKVALNMNGFCAVFLVPILLLVGLCALYGMKNGDGASAGKGVHTGAHWFFYHLLSGGMVLALVAHDGFLFLLAWEAMSIAPFFLITLHDDGSATRSAAWTYLVAAHLGTLFLLAFFASLAAQNGGTFDFQLFLTGYEYQGTPNRLCFLFALIGFGAKFVLMPLHVWLPEAHPAAPSHVSALMSGAMVNLGI